MDCFRRSASIGNALDLIAIRHAAVMFTPRAFPSVANEILTGDVVAVADFGAPHPAKEALSVVRVVAIVRAVDLFGYLLGQQWRHLEAGMQGTP
jgi:hypothetical protein